MSESIENLPEISSLPSLPHQTHEAILSLLFEPSPALNDVAAPPLAKTSYESYPSMIGAVGDALRSLQETGDLTRLDEILSSHPRLGEKKVDSALSRAEQAAMAKASASHEASDAEKEAETLRGLNKEYEDTFPGLRYVVFVNGRPRTIIFEDMRERIKRGDIKAERLEAIQAMCDIAIDRAKKLQ